MTIKHDMGELFFDSKRDLVSLHVSVSSHKPKKAEDLVSLHVSVSSHIPRKAEDLVSLHVLFVTGNTYV
jgi:LPS O-antigen subunit length determinant protein (WzzB/FepE family)